MTIRKKFLYAVLIGIVSAGYVTLLVKLAGVPPTRVSQCIQYAYSCYNPPLRFWP